MTPLASDIVARSDAGEHPDQIAATLPGCTLGYVYTVLREYRPRRKRKPRRCTSDIPDKVRALDGAGIKQARIAFLLGITRAYVSKILR